MPNTLLGWVHVALALGALAAGAAVAIAEKGSPRHALLGRAYGCLMLGVNGTAS